MKSKSSEYNFPEYYKIDDSSNIETAIEYTIMNYMHLQLGWKIEDCKKRVSVETSREIPKYHFNYLENLGWNLKNKKVLDVGSGQGGAVIEALKRDADAFGIEPGTEFLKLSKMRLKEAGFDLNRVSGSAGEKLPFENNCFDYVISLQVLEHVNNPEEIIREMYRVLKPGGKCYICCENYLSFKEEHYRIPWLPMLPKFLGSLYLRIIGRNPYFLNNYIFYTTYPQIWYIVKNTGFKNLTYNDSINLLLDGKKTLSTTKKLLLLIIKLFPKSISRTILLYSYHIRNFCKVGIRVVLEKPGN